MSKKRITLYLDTSIEKERIIYEYLDGKRKNETIRNILYDYINGIPVPNVVQEDVLDDLEFDMIDDILKWGGFIPLLFYFYIDIYNYWKY